MGNPITINNRSFTRRESVWSFFLPIAILLVQYGYGLGNIMLTYCILYAGYCVVRYQEFPVFRPLSVYTLWYVFILLCTVLFGGHSANRVYMYHLIRILISGYCVAIIAKHLDKESLYRCWKIVGLIVCAVVAYQFFQTFFLKQSVLPIRLLPVRSEDLLRNENWITLSNRPVAFFTEPAMVVAFLTPVLLFAQQKKEWLVTIIVSIAILLSGSTSGVIALVVMWGISLVNYRTSNTYKFFMVLLLIVAVFAFLNLSYFSDSLEKFTFELSGESTNMNTRTWRGWWIYGVLDTRSKLFGISDYNVASYVYKYAGEFTWQTGYEENFYLNTAQRILIQTGIVGAVLYTWMLIKLWISTNKAVRPYLAVVIISMFFASNFYMHGMFIMQFIVLLSYLKRYEVASDVDEKVKKQKQYVQEIH